MGTRQFRYSIIACVKAFSNSRANSSVDGSDCVRNTPTRRREFRANSVRTELALISRHELWCRRSFLRPIRKGGGCFTSPRSSSQLPALSIQFSDSSFELRNASYDAAAIIGRRPLGKSIRSVLIL